MEAELAYYRRRSADEKAAAAQAFDHRVREIHLDLARRYLERVAILEAHRRELHLRLIPAA